MQTIPLYDAIQKADMPTLVEMLQKASVEVGYYNGRRITVPGYSGNSTSVHMHTIEAKLIVWIAEHRTITRNWKKMQVATG